MRILLDLDCVLADFVSGASAAHGLDPAEVVRHWPAGTYRMQYAVGAALGRGEGWDPAEFWASFHGRRDFWANLPVLPWAAELAALVTGLTEDWWVVTSQSRCDQCYPGKVDWCRNFFGAGAAFDEGRVIPLRAKYLLANPDVVLVDDCDENVDRFVAAGGWGVTFPAHHNKMHHHKSDPMARVVPRLHRIAAELGRTTNRSKETTQCT